MVKKTWTINDVRLGPWAVAGGLHKADDIEIISRQEIVGDEMTQIEVLAHARMTALCGEESIVEAVIVTDEEGAEVYRVLAADIVT